MIIKIVLYEGWASLVAQTVKNLPAMQETWVQSLCGKDPLEKGMPVFLPRDFHGQRSLVGQGPWGHKELDTTGQLTHTHRKDIAKSVYRLEINTGHKLLIFYKLANTANMLIKWYSLYIHRRVSILKIRMFQISLQVKLGKDKLTGGRACSQPGGLGSCCL